MDFSRIPCLHSPKASLSITTLGLCERLDARPAPSWAVWGRFNLATESQYWQRFRPLLVPRVYAWKINASYVKGVPDWWGSGTQQDLWVENKRIHNDGDVPAMLDLTDSSKYLTFHQQDWLTERHREGRDVGVLVFSKEGFVYMPDLTWQQPISKLDFLSAALPKKEMAEKLIEILGERA